MDKFNQLPAIIITLPILIAAIIAILPTTKNGRGLAGFICTTTTFFVFIAAAILLADVIRFGDKTYAFGGWPPPIGIEYKATKLTAFMLFLFAGIGYAVSHFAVTNIESEIKKRQVNLFYSCYLLFLAGVMGMVITNDIFNAYVFIEISSLTAYALTSLGKDKRAVLSAFNYLIVGTIGGVLFLIGIAFLYSETGSLNYSHINEILLQKRPDNLTIGAFVFIFTGLAIKCAMFPLCGWLPKAYANAPTTISAIISATGTKVACILIIRIIFEVFGKEFVFDKLDFGQVIIILSICGILYGSISAVLQTNYKSVLAYSSIANIGYITLGIGLASIDGLTASLVQIANHSIIKAALFLIVGTAIFGKNSLEGFGKTNPVLAVCFIVLGLSLIGVPFTAGFISKWYLLSTIFSNGSSLVQFACISAVALGSISALIYVLRAYELMFYHLPSKNYVVTKFNKSVIVTFTGLSVIYGVYPYQMVKFFQEVAEAIIHG